MLVCVAKNFAAYGRWGRALSSACAIAAISCTCLLSGDVLSAAEPSAGDLEFFEKQIRPLLVQHCYECHSGASKKIQGGLRLDASAAWLAGGDTGPAVVPGDLDKSLLVRAMRYADSDLEMPPRGKLPAEIIQLFEQWVAKGAPAPAESAEATTARPTIDLAVGRQFWCYRPIVAPPLPQPRPAADAGRDRCVCHRRRA